jgi:hypothetical protein
MLGEGQISGEGNELQMAADVPNSFPFFLPFLASFPENE